MKNKKKSLGLVLLLLLVGLTSGYVAHTYAKYTSQITGKQGTAVIAKWAFDEENASTNLELNLAETYDTTTLVEGRIAPGTEGEFAIQLTNGETETKVHYEIAFGDVSGIPTNLKFTLDGEEFDPTTESITGFLKAADEQGETVILGWEWEYETLDGEDSTVGDVADTANGKAGGEDGTLLVLPITITGTQVPATPANG